MSESRNDTRPFPKPFGGIPVEYDFPITLIFAIGFAVAFGVNVYSTCRKGNRSIVKTISLSLTVERMLVSGMRMAQSLDLDARESRGLTEYMQVTLGVGFLSLIQEQVYLMLSAATSATWNGLTYQEWMTAAEKNPGIKEARKGEREGFRKWTARMDWTIVFVQGVQISMAVLALVESQTRNTPWILCGRFVGNVMGTFIAMGLLSNIRRLKDVEGINKVALQRMKVTLVAILFIPLSRCFLSFETATTLSTSPSDPGSIIFKVAFYLLQFLPEVTACLITATTDYNTLCDAGKWGDYPRHRVEKGLPAMPAWFAVFGHFYKPCKWPRLFTPWVLRKRAQRQQKVDTQRRLQEYGFKSDPLYYEDGEKLLPNASSMGWQSPANLSHLHEFRQPLTIDVEKQSVRTERSFPSSDWSTSGFSRTSSQATVGSKSSLITDVNLWTPRLIMAISSDADGR